MANKLQDLPKTSANASVPTGYPAASHRNINTITAPVKIGVPGDCPAGTHRNKKTAYIDDVVLKSVLLSQRNITDSELKK